MALHPVKEEVFIASSNTITLQPRGTVIWDDVLKLYNYDTVPALCDVIKKHSDIFVVNIFGNVNPAGKSMTDLGISLYEEKGNYENQYAVIHNTGRITHERFNKLVEIGNEIAESAAQSDDLYVVFMQAIRKYNMDVEA